MQGHSEGRLRPLVIVLSRRIEAGFGETEVAARNGSRQEAMGSRVVRIFDSGGWGL